MIKIDTLWARDLGSVIDLEIKSQEFPLSLDVARTYVEAADKCGFLATIGGREVGHLLLALNQVDKCGIIRVSVHPSFRLKGVARKLIGMANKTVFTRGLGKLRINVPSYKVEDMEDPWNIKAWLQREQFKATGVVEGEYKRYGTSYDAYIFERPA